MKVFLRNEPYSMMRIKQQPQLDSFLCAGDSIYFRCVYELNKLIKPATPLEAMILPLLQRLEFLLLVLQFFLPT